jgi:hypothetical protein
METTT